MKTQPRDPEGRARAHPDRDGGACRLAQRFVRHASPLTTIIYTHPADEELAAGVRDLPC